MGTMPTILFLAPFYSGSLYEDYTQIQVKYFSLRQIVI